MANLSADRNTAFADPGAVRKSSGPAAAGTFYVGGLLCKTAGTGGNFFIQRATGSNSNAVCLGVASGRPLASGSAPPFTVSVDGADNIEYVRGEIYLDNDVTPNDLSFNDVGNLCYVLDDHTVSKSSGAGRMIAGRLVGFVSSSSGQPRKGAIVHVDPGTSPVSASSGIAMK